jgi:hypothetical protein
MDKRTIETSLGQVLMAGKPQALPPHMKKKLDSVLELIDRLNLMSIKIKYKGWDKSSAPFPEQMAMTSLQPENGG